MEGELTNYNYMSNSSMEGVSLNNSGMTLHKVGGGFEARVDNLISSYNPKSSIFPSSGGDSSQRWRSRFSLKGFDATVNDMIKSNTYQLDHIHFVSDTSPNLQGPIAKGPYLINQKKKGALP